MPLNPKTVGEIFQRTPTAEAFAAYAACRNRNVRLGISKLPGIRAQMTKEGFDPVPQDLLSMFKELERAGAGTLSDGTFKWNVPIKKIGEIVSDESPKEKIRLALVPPPKEGETTLIVCFPSGKTASISLSSKLTVEECQFMCDKILRTCG